jgi:hypothetical protein
MRNGLGFTKNFEQWIFSSYIELKNLMSDIRYRNKLFHCRINPISDYRPTILQIFVRYRTKLYRCQILDIGNKII